MKRSTYRPTILALVDFALCDSCATIDDSAALVPVTRDHEQTMCDQCEDVVINQRWVRQD